MKTKTFRSAIFTLATALLLLMMSYAVYSKPVYAASPNVTWVIQENTAGQITSVKLDMSSFSSYGKYLVNIYKDNNHILQNTVTTPIYDVTDIILSSDSGVFRADGMAYKTGSYANFESDVDLKFYTITVNTHGHGDNVKLNHIKDGTAVKTSLKNAYISTFDTGGDSMLMRYFDKGEAFVGVALHSLNNYSSMSALKAEGCYLLPGGSGQSYTLGGDVTVHSIWFKVIDTVELSVKAPSCGDTTSISKNSSDDWDWDSQTNKPEVAITGGTGFNYTSGNSWWVQSAKNDGVPYAGDFTGGNEYTFQISVASAFGYVFPKDSDAASTTVKVNGQTIASGNCYNDNMPYSYDLIGDEGSVPLNIDGVISVNHSYDKGTITKEADCINDGLKTFTCSGCQDKYTEPIPSDPDAHYFVGSETITKATLTDNGEISGLTCSICSKTNTQAIPHPAQFDYKKSYTYDGSPKKPVVTVLDADGKTIDVSNYDVAYSDNVNAGTATAKITFKGDYYEGTKNLSFKITPVKVSVPSGKKLTYNGKSQTGVNADANWTVTGDSAVTAGSYKAVLTLKDKNNYIWEDGSSEDKAVTWEIAPASIESALVSGLTSKTYTGKALKPKPVVKTGSSELKSGTDYTVSYKNNKDAGKATVTISGKGNYKGTISKKFTIAKAKQPMTVKTKAVNLKAKKLKNKAQSITKTKAFTVDTAKGNVTFAKIAKGSSKNLTISKSGKITVKKGTKAGTYKIKVKVTAAGDKNHKKGTTTKTVNITVK